MLALTGARKKAISPTGALYYAFQNSLALNSTGYPHVVYHHKYSSTDRDIYFRKATTIDGSAWATAKALRTATTDDREPCIAVSGENKTYVCWYDNRRGNYYNVYYNYSTDCGITWLAQDIKINITGVALRALTVNLYKGRNSVGWCNFTATDAKSVAQNITNCTALAYWDNSLGRFITHPVNSDISNFIVERGRGYLVDVTTKSSLIQG